MAKRGQSKYMPHMRAKAPVTRYSNGIGHLSSTPYVSDTMRRHDAMIDKAKTNQLKGQRGGDCNRTQCQRANAWWYNKTMQAYYCGDCAAAINESCLTRDHVTTFKDMIYVKPPTVAVEQVQDNWAVAITTADGTVSHHPEFIIEEAAHEWMHRFYMYADLRSDGSAPFHYSELPEKMERLKKRIEELTVSSEEHSVGRA